MSKSQRKEGRREGERKKEKEKGKEGGRGQGGAHLNLNFTLYTKINTRWITDLCVK